MVSCLLFDLLVKTGLKANMKISQIEDLMLKSYVIPITFASHLEKLTTKAVKIAANDVFFQQTASNDIKIQSCVDADGK